MALKKTAPKKKNTSGKKKSPTEKEAASRLFPRTSLEEAPEGSRAIEDIECR